MLKIFSNFIHFTSFLDGMNDTLEKRDFYLHGNDDLKYKPISIFNDHPANDHQLFVNDINILMIMEPNQLFGLHNYALQNWDKYNIILTWGQEILDHCPNAVFHPFGISWLDKEYINNVDNIDKKFEVSFLCGGKQRIEGHHLRHKLYKREKEIIIPKQWYYTLPDYDYNNGHHTIVQYEGKSPGYEKLKLWNSMFSICIENSSNRNYHTEKVIDAFLSKTIPVYWGCPNLEELGYDPNGFIYCNNDDEIINTVNKLTPDDYYSRKEAIEYNFEVAKYYADLFGRTREMLIQICELNSIADDQFASQEGEDKWIVNNLNLPENGTFLDIGACYPITISNTYHFEKYKGWNGLAIEPDPTYFKLFSEGRNCIVENVAIHPTEKEMWFKEKSNLVVGEEGDFKVKCARLDDLLEKHNITKIDLISIDVEGFEDQVWSSFDYKKYSPEVMIVEHTEMGQYNDNFTKQLLQDPNYEIVHATPLNFIIAKKGLKK
jgi:FkbM family methyltransferase